MILFFKTQGKEDQKMKKILKVEQEFYLKTLCVSASVRYTGDSSLNGKADFAGEMPFLKNGLWCPEIDLDSGIVKDWPKGIKAAIHYKVCDCGDYSIKDEAGKTVLEIKQYYVPKIMSPKENGYGDYIIMDIDENGQIQDWKISLVGFEEEE